VLAGITWVKGSLRRAWRCPCRFPLGTADLPYETAEGRTPRPINGHTYGAAIRTPAAGEERKCLLGGFGTGGANPAPSSGYNDLTRYHMNEVDNAALLMDAECLAQKRTRKPQKGRGTLRIFRGGGHRIEKKVATSVWSQHHTPVPAVHDRFPMEFLTRALGHFPVLKRGARTSLGLLERDPLRSRFDESVALQAEAEFSGFAGRAARQGAC